MEKGYLVWMDPLLFPFYFDQSNIYIFFNFISSCFYDGATAGESGV